MPIVAYCPECRERYQLHEEVRGRRMRCQNRSCNSIFTIVETEEPQRKDSPVEVADWRTAPPPIQNSESKQTKPRRKDRKEKYPVAQPASKTAENGQPKPAPPFVFDEPAPRQRGAWSMALLLVLVLGLIAGGTYLVVNRIARSEEILRTDAEREYAAGSFRTAAKKYEELGTKFGKSSRSSEYQFLAALAGLHEVASRSPPEPSATMESATAFVQNFGRDPLLKDRRDELASVLATTANEFISQAQAAVTSDAEIGRVPELVQKATAAVRLAERYPSRDADPAALNAKIDTINATRVAIQNRQGNIGQVVALLKAAKPDLDAARALIRRHQLDREPSVMAALADAERVASAIKYEVLNRPAQPSAPTETVPSVMLEPALPLVAEGQSETILSMSRGLLYALDSRTGQRQWIARVGLDLAGLPIRVAANGGESELVLVPSTESPSLSARDLKTGAVRWHQTLDAPILGRPVLAGNRLLVPTAGADGQVFDIDPRDGLIRGRFVTGQTFAAGSAFDSSSGRLYVPTHSQYVCVFSFSPSIEVAGPSSTVSPKCEGLMPTGHSPGSLRGEPIVVTGDAGVDVPRYLVLGEADGMEAMKLRAFRLLDKPTAIGPTSEVRLPGWSWFAPYRDPEKLVLVTDAGSLGLIGIQQKDNTDSPVFPLLGRDASPIETSRATARAELVHAEDHGFWALAAGKLQHWRLGLDRRLGPKLTPAWNSSLPLGSPMHASHVSRDRQSLFLTTQTESPAGYWATAVDARTGREHWRRPLGLSVQSDPFELGTAVVVLDPTGALFRFEHETAVNGAWVPSGRRVFNEIKGLIGVPRLLRSADGRQAVLAACRAEGPNVELVLRQLGQHGSERTTTIALPSPMVGVPALSATAIIVPLADGSLARVPLNGENRRDIGPNWRSLGARPDARCTVIARQADEFLVSDGQRKLMRLRWSAGSKYELDSPQHLELPGRPEGMARIGESGEGSGVFVADSTGALSLIRGESFRIERTWRVTNANETITAGPWTVGFQAYVIVSGKRLVAIDPKLDQPAWSFVTPGDGITFSPALIDGHLVIADQSGTFFALDPTNGAIRGTGFRHPAAVAPTAAPAAFGTGRFFAPLTDGSALVLTVADLTKP